MTLIIRGDARALPLVDDSVDLIVTSPPYFALRSYTDGGQHYAGQLGSEGTPAEYIVALIACTREWVRVLKPSGSIFVNLGDSYVTTPRGPDGSSSALTNGEQQRPGRRPSGGLPRKSLMLLPERYRIAAVDELGLIARAVMVWLKPNGLPEPVTDRVRRSHEDWVHLTKQPRYFAAVDEIREPHARTWGGSPNGGGYYGSQLQPGAKDANLPHALPNPLGKLPGSVWEVPTEPLKVPERLGVDHFAAFPSEWPRRLILGWSPAGICTACGEGRRPVAVTDLGRKERLTPVYSETAGVNGSARHGKGASTLGSRGSSATITGYACACPDTTAPTRPAVVLDPFGGTGTTAHVADALGRTGITVDLSRDYCRVAAAPELADARRRKVLGLEKPKTPEPTELMPDLFSLMAEEAGA